MSLWHIAWSYLWNRKLTTVMTVVSVALGVGLISAVLTLREQTQKRFEEEGQAFDLVVGPKGNPLQLVLSAVYFMDMPVGTCDKAEVEKIAKLEDVTGVYPIGMGDTYGNYRIIGTVRELMDLQWGDRHPYALAQGDYWTKPYEAVVGAEVAQNTKLKIGDKFVGTCGVSQSASSEVHEDKPYIVTGILALSGTPNDRAIFCDIASVWDTHEHQPEPGETAEADAHEHHKSDEISAALVKLATPARRPEYRQKINREYNVMAAIPVIEIKKLYDQLLGTAKAVMLAIGYLVVVISSMSILIGLYMAILQRRRDLAIMRALGATRGEIFGAVLIEAFWVTLLGLGAGWALGALACRVLGHYLAVNLGFHIAAVSLSADVITAYSAVLLMGMIAGILPAWQAYRTDIARDLAEP